MKLYKKIKGGFQKETNETYDDQIININHRAIKLERKVAEGGFGFIYEGIDQNTYEKFAVKKLAVFNDEQFEQLQNEVKFQKKLSDHENIVSLFDSQTTHIGNKKNVVILMEYCPDTLVKMMERKLEHSSQFSEDQVLKIFHSICMGVHHMHTQDPPIAHRDLKIENVLIGNDSIFKLCDFGSATTKQYFLESQQERYEAEEDIQANTTLTYRAPEMIDLYRENPITEKVDIWALGCVLYQLLFFKEAFDQGSELQILNGTYEIPKSQANMYSKEIIQLLHLMFTQDPEERPDIFDILDSVCNLMGKKPPQKPKNSIRKKQQNKKQNSQAKNQPNISKQPSHQGDQSQQFFSNFQWYDETNEEVDEPKLDKKGSKKLQKKPNTKMNSKSGKKPVLNLPKNQNRSQNRSQNQNQNQIQNQKKNQQKNQIQNQSLYQRKIQPK
eukprot:Anaeramoba_ignava/a1088_45.p1 GENE.a1088_45~~a1088_45.p1  ORF type:complete len:441 (+),score=172.18 a1088_45:23-1345(+)